VKVSCIEALSTCTHELPLLAPAAIALNKVFLSCRHILSTRTSWLLSLVLKKLPDSER
jgi:hypothetical protein